jgi:hypothetical protein
MRNTVSVGREVWKVVLGVKRVNGTRTTAREIGGKGQLSEGKY